MCLESIYANFVGWLKSDFIYKLNFSFMITLHIIEIYMSYILSVGKNWGKNLENALRIECILDQYMHSTYCDIYYMAHPNFIFLYDSYQLLIRIKRCWLSAHCKKILPKMIKSLSFHFKKNKETKYIFRWSIIIWKTLNY